MDFIKKRLILIVGLFVFAACGHRDTKDHKDTVLIYQCQGDICQCTTPPEAPFYPRPAPYPENQGQEQGQEQGQKQAGKVVVVVNATSDSSSEAKLKSSSCNTNYNLLKNNRFERRTKCKNKKPCLSFGNWSYSEFEEDEINLEYEINSCDNIELETLKN